MVFGVLVVFARLRLKVLSCYPKVHR